MLENVDRDIDGELSYVFRYIFKGVKVKGLILGKDVVINDNQRFIFEKYGLQPSGISDSDMFIKAGQFTRLVRTYLYESGAYPVPDKYVETNTYSITCKLGVRARGNGRPTSKRDFFFIKLRESLDFLKTCRKNYKFNELRGLTEQAIMAGQFMRRHKGSFNPMHKSEEEHGAYLAGGYMSSYPKRVANSLSKDTVGVPGGSFASLHRNSGFLDEGDISNPTIDDLMPDNQTSEGNLFLKRQKRNDDKSHPNDEGANKANSESFNNLISELGYLRDRVYQLENLLHDLKRLDLPEPLTDEETSVYREMYEQSMNSTLSQLHAMQPAHSRTLPPPQSMKKDSQSHSLHSRAAGPTMGMTMGFPTYFDVHSASTGADLPRMGAPPMPLYPPHLGDIRQIIGDGSRLVNLSKEELMGLVQLMSQPPGQPVVSPTPPQSTRMPLSTISMNAAALRQDMSTSGPTHPLPRRQFGNTSRHATQTAEYDELESREEAILFDNYHRRLDLASHRNTILPMTYPTIGDLEEADALAQSSRHKDRAPRKRRTKMEMAQARLEQDLLRTKIEASLSAESPATKLPSTSSSYIKPSSEGVTNSDQPTVTGTDAKPQCHVG